MATPSKSTFDEMIRRLRFMPKFECLLGLKRSIFMGLLLTILMLSARADVWAYVDAKGMAHFAAERLDDRYELYAQGNAVVDTAALGESTAPSAESTSPAMSKVLVFFDIFPAYKAVKHHLQEAAAAHEIDYELLQAIIATESGFDAGAVSPRGATGLMQLMPATASRFGVKDDKKRSVAQKLTNPGVNIETGSRYLHYLLNLFPGQVELALAAYNAGEGAVQRAGNQIPSYKETQRYVKTVMALYVVLKPPLMAAFQANPPNRVQMLLYGGATGRSNMTSSASAMPANSTFPIETDEIQ
ncbi:lytic transglycosylase domain-containing protein [Rhodoferax sp. PAMC 29310]|uniref:lytic transglycosylase domain-containing protein n=1 Tax=Rhodoferax sp. PAMC 29310 TaxID=2822760 RepID=UPI001F0A2BAC|nr:lytic transglycosylase domain-containing protein [Rhodoferax sp. PAMC 29310]